MKQPYQRSLPSWQKIIALACCWLAAVLTAQAQSATGSIQGRVFNPVSKDYVNNAEVRLDGTQQVVFTENDGSFRFNNVAPGQASISITYTGYTTVHETFTVTAGEPAVREINIVSTAATAPTTNKDGVVQLQAFTVASEREGNSKAIQAQRKDMNIVTAVSSDIFGDMTDGNVGEFLKYLPGVDLDYVESEPRGPRLGGMDGQYVGVAFDGNRSASADANRGGGAASRATSFEGFSITSIDSIEINWTTSPENDADTPAGNVNMKTKRAFDRKGRRLEYNVGANFNSDEFTLGNRTHIGEHPQYQWKPNWQFTYSESYLDQKLGILVSANRGWSTTEQTTETMTYNFLTFNTATGASTPAGTAFTGVNDNRQTVIQQIDFKDGPKVIRKDALLLTADWKVTPRLVLSLNLSYSYFSGDFWNRNTTFVAALNNNNTLQGRQTILGDGSLTVIAPRDTTVATGTIVNGAVTNNGNAAINYGGGAADKMTWTRQYAPRFEYKVGALTVDGTFSYSESVNHYKALDTGFTVASIGGIAGGWTATRPNDRSWEWVIKQNSGPDMFSTKSFTSTNTQTGGTSVQDRNDNWTTEKYTGMLNGKYVLPFMQRFPTSLKVGSKWDEESRRNRNVSADNKYTYIGPGGNTATYNPATEVWSIATFNNWNNLGPQYGVSDFKFDSHSTNMLTAVNAAGVISTIPRTNLNTPADLFHEHPEMFVRTSSVNDYFNAHYANERNFRQTITAGYGQFDTRVTSKLQIRTGVRWEQTENRLVEFDPLSAKQMFETNNPFKSQFTKTTNATTGVVTYTPALATSKSGIDYQMTHNPRVTKTSKYDNYFPSFVAKYQILPNFEWQAGWNKGLARPAIDNLTGLATYNDNATPPTVSLANPLLLPEKHEKYQTRLAYYFGGKSPGQLTASVTQDTVTNFISSKNYDDGGAALGIDDPDLAGYRFVSFQNDPSVHRYRNFDFGYNQTLGFLQSEYLRGINLGATYSRSYDNQRHVNLVPRRFGFTPSYTFRNFSTGVGILWTDKKPSSSTYGEYYGAMTKIDFRLGWRFNARLSAYLQVRNITNVKDAFYRSPPGYQEGTHGVLRQMEEYGANWVFGVKGTF